MNYRHAYHAGNFADCFKHALLVALLDGLARKPAPFCVMDTHAGAGRYDLSAEAALRTGEAEAGIKRLLAVRPAALHRYLGLVDALGLYPGSPALIRACLRREDRLVCCELHPQEAAELRRGFGRAAEVHQRSGWEAMRALLPPREKRGLVFIDPPFEDREEFSNLTTALAAAHGRFGHGVFAAWYPIKQLAAVRGFHAVMKASGTRDVVTIEMHLRSVTAADRLNGCGLLVINPPFGFADQAMVLAGAVLDGLGVTETGAGVTLIRLTDE